MHIVPATGYSMTERADELRRRHELRQLGLRRLYALLGLAGIVFLLLLVGM
jgi:hypothetical protein